jgi:hypothetical protein
MSSLDAATHSRIDPRQIDDVSRGRFARAARALRRLGPGGVFALARQHGVSGSYAFVARNIRFLIADRLARDWDRQHKVDTSGSVQLHSLSIAGPNRASGNECLCTSPKTFDFMMRYLPMSLAGFTFVDIGAGKSRTLLLASRYDFDRIVGVEFAKELVDYAQDNIKTFSADWQQCRNLETVWADATQYALPDSPLVLFFYNPFSRDVFEAVLRNISTSLRANKRECYIVYSSSSANAIDWARPTILQSGLFREIRTAPSPRFWDAVRVVRFAVFKAN